MSIDLGDAASWTSAIVAFLAAVHSWLSSKESDRYQKESAQYAKKNAEILEKQHELDHRSWIDQHFNGVRVWADDVCKAIAEALHIVKHPNAEAERRLDVLMRLSALIDTGRWYFPNKWSDEYGGHKEPAYRGIRQPVLDHVVEAYDCLNGGGDNRVASLVSAQRNFVSEIQIVLDPHQRQSRIESVLKEFEIAERLRALPKQDKQTI